MKNFWNIVITLLSLASVVLLTFLLKNYPAEDIIEPLSKVGVLHIAVLLGLSFTYLLLYTVRWQRILKLEGWRVPLRKLLALRLAGYSFSYVTFFANYGGEPVMAYFLNKAKPKIGFSRSFASVIAARIISAIPETFFLILALFYTFFLFVLPGKSSSAIYIPLILIIGFIFLLYYFVLKEDRPFARILRLLRLDKIPAVRNKMHKIRKFDSLFEDFFHENPRELLINLGISFINICSAVLMFWLLARFIGLGIGILDAVVLHSIVWTVGSIIPIPANIGTGEGGASAWFGLLGLGAAQGFGFYLLIRAKDIIFSIAGAVILLNKGILKNLSQIRKGRRIM